MKLLSKIDENKDIVNKEYVDNIASDKVDNTDIATDSDYGIVKTNSAQNITLNANGQLEVGGRIGQFEGTTGLFAPNNRAPRMVGNYCLLVTDVKGVSMTNSRAFAMVSGYGQTCKSAPAGTTEYHVTNNYANRIACKILENGFAAKDEASSTVETIPVVSVTIDGQPYDPDSAPDDSTKDIVITTERTLNPDSETTTVRAVGLMAAYSTAHIGNGICSQGGGRNLLLGGAITKDGQGNDNCVVGQGHYVNGNGNGVFGRYHIVRKNRGFYAGTGHDSTNARGEGVSALGQYSLLDGNTLFAVGNGTSHTNRSNAFEVASNATKAYNLIATAKRIEIEQGEYDEVAPELISSNWGTNANWSFSDGVLTFNGVSSALNCNAKSNFVIPVKEGDILEISFEAKKENSGAIGNLGINLRTATSTGSTTADNIVIDNPSSTITTEWATYTGTFIVPSGINYLLPRIMKGKGTVGSGQKYQIRNFSIKLKTEKGLYMISPNGTKYQLVVDDSGNISTIAV